MCWIVEIIYTGQLHPMHKLLIRYPFSSNIITKIKKAVICLSKHLLGLRFNSQLVLGYKNGTFGHAMHVILWNELHYSQPLTHLARYAVVHSGLSISLHELISSSIRAFEVMGLPLTKASFLTSFNTAAPLFSFWQYCISDNQIHFVSLFINNTCSP